MRVCIIGSGNVATELGRALRRSGHKILFVCSPNVNHARKLGKELKCKWGNTLSEVSSVPAEIYLIAVKDDVIPEVIRHLPSLDESLVLHTSGATSVSVLKKKFRNCGVLWPLQTIRSGMKTDFKEVPLIVEASNPASENNLRRLAGTLSKNVHVFTSRQRQILHLAAVWVNNFPNHLYVLAEALLKKHRLPFDLMAPIILSTAENGIKNPLASQTGPAKRNDRKTMKAHVKLLPDKNYKALYKLISGSILKHGKLK